MELEKKLIKVIYTINSNNTFKDNLSYEFETFGDFKEGDTKKYLARRWEVHEDNIIITKVEVDDI